jgi:hypothetical protein
MKISGLIFMKRLITILYVVFGLVAENAFSQINLVPNPSFEDSLGCPSAAAQINLTTYWRSGLGGIDLFRECGYNGYSIPSNYVGFESANTGVSYVGYAFFHKVVHNFREFVEVELSDSLVANGEYFVEFYVSLADSEQYAIWNIGAFFSANGVQGNSLSQILSYTPQITNTSGNYITNKNGWTKIKGSFIANGGEKFITIGNYEDDSVIDTLFVGGSSSSGSYDWRGSGYYLDDVAVYEDTTVGSSEATGEERVAKVFPNPAKNEITIMFEKESGINTTIEVFDLLGNIMLNENIIPKIKQETISISQLSSGIYFYKIISGNEMLDKGKLAIIR